ncbi:MAG TPA: glycerate kinase [Solirubrobacterales bacterium]|nr:glycerate kinase [Solirubrobacterales bacterium]
MTRFLVAPDSFKGTLSARQVAEAIGRGLEDAGAVPDLCPAADGGEGTADVLLDALGGERRTAEVHDPLGRAIEATYALVRDGSEAVVEVAAASGLGLVGEEERDAERASSAGTGELIVAAAAAGADRILVAAGGSATTDGGRGAIDAIEAAGGLGDRRIEVLCDTTVPFERAAAVFAPQKGASSEAVERLTSRLAAEAGALPRDPRGRAMTGAAGGLSGGLWAAFGAHLVLGSTFVLGVVGFDRRLEQADAAITGEGRLDAQSREGKLTGQIARRCRDARVPCHLIAGEIALDPDDEAWFGFATLASAGSRDSISGAAERIAASASG